MKSYRKRIKTPTVIQMEAVECGAAALGIILGYYGVYPPLEKLRLDCAVSRDGSRASSILKAAKEYNLEGKGYILPEGADLDELFESELPVILFWENNHFLVLEGIKKNKVYLNDPAYGPRTVTLEEFELSFSKVFLSFKKQPGFRKSKKLPNVFKALLTRLKGSELDLLLAMLVTLSMIVPGIMIPALSRLFIDDYLIKGNSTWLGPIMVSFAITAIFMIALNWVQQTIFIKLGSKLALHGMYNFMWHLLRLPIVFFSARSPGDVMSRLQSNSAIASLLTGGLATAIFNMFQVVFYGLFLAFYSWQLTIIVVFFAAVNVVVYYAARRLKRDISFRTQEAGAKLTGTTMLGNKIIESLKASGNENDFFTRWAGFQAKYINAYQQQSWLSMITSLFPNIASNISTALVLGIGCILIIKGEFTIGGLVAFNMIAAQFKAPINGLVALGSGLQQMEVEIKRINDVQNYTIDVKYDRPKKLPAKINKIKLSGHLELKDITFGYSSQEPPLIKDFNLKLFPGSRIALVGMSGSGKSTIAKLTTGLYQPWSGSILFDNTPIQEIPSDILSCSLSMVNQELFFFKGTVRENICLWNNSVSEETMIKTAKMAEIYDEIVTREKAFESDVNEGGTNFSGGQLQRMEIARALINDPSILIMDEASSALDPIVETRIDRNLRAIGATCLIIAHRVSTVRDCDEIIVLSKGSIIERGTHDELIKLSGYYCDLIKAE